MLEAEISVLNPCDIPVSPCNKIWMARDTDWKEGEMEKEEKMERKKEGEEKEGSTPQDI